MAIKGSRDDWIRTSDHTPPRRVFYRAELRPEFKMHECVFRKNPQQRKAEVKAKLKETPDARHADTRRVIRLLIIFTTHR